MGSKLNFTFGALLPLSDPLSGDSITVQIPCGGKVSMVKVREEGKGGFEEEESRQKAPQLVPYGSVLLGSPVNTQTMFASHGTSQLSIWLDGF